MLTVVCMFIFLYNCVCETFSCQNLISELISFSFLLACFLLPLFAASSASSTGVISVKAHNDLINGLEEKLRDAERRWVVRVCVRRTLGSG